MSAVQHWLIGYDQKTEAEEFELKIPERAFREVGTLVRFDVDDPEGTGCYELTDIQAKRIASMVRNEVPFALPRGLNFFLEAYR